MGFLIISAVLFAVLSVVAIKLVKNKGCFIMLLILSLFCIRSIAIINNSEKLNTLNGISDTVDVTVVATQSAPEQSGFGSCTVRVNNSIYLDNNTRISLLMNGAETLELGDRLKLNVSYRKIQDEYKYSFYSEGIYLSAFSNVNYGSVKTQKGIYQLAGNVRRHINSRILNNTDNAHVLMAVLTGERAYMSNEFYETVKNSGVSHIIVVSGMHLAIISLGIERILRLFFKNEILINAILLSFVFFMCVICGMSISVMRAGIVYLIRAVYKVINRNSNNVHCLSFAALLVVFINPYAIFSVVFKLSFASTFGILVLPQLFDEKFTEYTEKSRILSGVADAVYVSLSAYLMTLPICISVFGYVSVVAVLVNILVSLATTVMLSFLVLAVVFGFVTVLEKLFFIIADMMADYFIKIVDYFGNLNYSTVTLRNPTLLTILLLAVYLIFYVVYFKPYEFLKRGGEIAHR